LYFLERMEALLQVAEILKHFKKWELEGSLDKKERRIIFVLEIWKKGVIYHGTRITGLETF